MIREASVEEQVAERQARATQEEVVGEDIVCDVEPKQVKRRIEVGQQRGDEGIKSPDTRQQLTRQDMADTPATDPAKNTGERTQLEMEGIMARVVGEEEEDDLQPRSLLGLLAAPITGSPLSSTPEPTSPSPPRDPSHCTHRAALVHPASLSPRQAHKPPCERTNGRPMGTEKEEKKEEEEKPVASNKTERDGQSAQGEGAQPSAWQRRQDKRTARDRKARVRKTKPRLHSSKEVPTEEALGSTQGGQLPRDELAEPGAGSSSQPRPQWHETQPTMSFDAEFHAAFGGVPNPHNPDNARYGFWPDDHSPPLAAASERESSESPETTQRRQRRGRSELRSGVVGNVDVTASPPIILRQRRPSRSRRPARRHRDEEDTRPGNKAPSQDIRNLQTGEGNMCRSRSRHSRRRCVEMGKRLYYRYVEMGKRLYCNRGSAAATDRCHRGRSR